MRRLWIIFAEFVTVTLAVVFVVTLIRPDWNPWRQNVVEIREAPTSAGFIGALTPAGHPTGSRASFADAAARAKVSVVNVSSSRQTGLQKSHPLANDPLFRRFFGLPEGDGDGDGEGDNGTLGGQQASLGSGVIVNADAKGGYVLTNDHVVANSRDIKLSFGDGRVLPAKLVGSDPETDLAVLRVEGTGLKAVTFGQSEKSQVGDVVLAIGDPFGVGQTVTMGIISALGRNRLGVNRYENFIQTDAAINPGNSGGALVDIHGNLLGINSVIYSRTGGSLGIGFAIPVSMAKDVMEQIIKDGSVTRGFIGIAPQDVTPELAESLKLKSARGSLVSSVNRGSPADKGGLKAGDVIISINDQPVQDSVAAMAAIAALKPGMIAKFGIIRGQKDATLNVEVGKRPRIQRNR